MSDKLIEETATYTKQTHGTNRYKITNKCVEVVVGFIDAFWIYPNMFQQVIAIIRRSWLPQKLLQQR
jgi:hypothetical protein